jgi:hypothetical protein
MVTGVRLKLLMIVIREAVIDITRVPAHLRRVNFLP